MNKINAETLKEQGRKRLALKRHIDQKRKRLVLRWFEDLPERCGVCGMQREDGIWGGHEWDISMEGVPEDQSWVCPHCLRKWPESGPVYARMLQLLESILLLEGACSDFRLCRNYLSAPFEKAAVGA